MSSRRQSSLSGCSEFERAARLHRRDAMQIGAVSALGLGLAQLQERLAFAQASGTISRGPRAKACIFLFMWGGPSQLETWDPKPDAPAEVRGEFRSIATKVPGTHISEHFTKMAQLTDKLTIIRSLTHNDPAHLSSGHATLTGHLAPVVNSDADAPSAKDSPHLGALLSKFHPTKTGIPPFVSMPWKAYHPAAPGGEAPGQHGGWLGSAYDGMLLGGDLNLPDWKPQGLSLPGNVGLERLESRVALLRSLDAQRDSLTGSTLGPSTLRSNSPTSSFRDHQGKAIDLLASPKVRQAFDLSQESPETRERYGRNIHGQCVLMARRLVEHGVPLVSVNWHNDGKNFWDTHGNNFNRLKNDLIPPADLALSALLEDLESRGMLDETIVAWVGEFGRKPEISAGNAGREHWPFCYSGVLAGGGFKRGLLYGSSDRKAAYPTTDPMSPQDFATTILHAMGVPTGDVLLDKENRPHRITSGRVITELLS